MSYKKMKIEVENLLINHENPRFDPVIDQQKALEVMLAKMKSKIKNLASDIADKGLNPTKSLCVFKSNQGKYVVLEGNRRLVAIKLIKKPNIVKHDSNLLKFFKELNRTGQSVPEALNCIVFENKADANHWIKLEHTGENKGVGQVPWNAKQTARYQSQIKQSNRPYIQVIELMEKHNISLKQGQATNIERLVITTYVKKKIGLDFQNKELIFKKNRQVVLSNLRKIAKAINKSGFNVGEIYNANKRKKWIDEILIDEQKPKTIITKRGGKTIKTTQQRTVLIPQYFTISISQNKVNLIYNELRTLNIDKYRNAVAVLFRVFLELSVDHFIKSKPSIKTELESQRHPPSLSKKIKFVSEYMEKKRTLTTNELQPIRMAISNEHNIFSTHTFNSYVHNLEHIPTSADLKVSWDNQEKFIKKLWE
ncbi:MAG: hypothetical protein OXM55_03920 [Bdellovibrionales bacterium]|nr:hypothetical protein [Bdellovibrionales bacterium]